MTYTKICIDGNFMLDCALLMSTERYFKELQLTNANQVLEKTWGMFGGPDGKQVTKEDLESLLKAALRVAELQDGSIEQFRQAQDLGNQEGVTTALDWLNQQSLDLTERITGFGRSGHNPIMQLRRAVFGYVPPELKEMSRRSQACATASQYLLNQLPNK